ncbi:MAG TPA: hypothetical protein VG735_02495 [Caulobacterales bacterium]|jgi:hypothetical protein|nr:hypothetical protein [Caulobacterales bacterium]
MADSEKAPALSSRDVADYVAVMAGELSEMCEGARLEALATILLAARLEARRTLHRLDAPRSRRADVG